MERLVKKKMEEQAQLSYQFIDDQMTFERCIAELEKEKVVAIDLESDSLFHYPEKICLIQMATQNRTVILDPLNIKITSLLQKILVNNRITKIFHDADYDIRSIYRDYQVEIKNLFDTQIACRLLGQNQLGLGAVLHNWLNIKIEKKFQKKDWSKRPLSEAMKQYAAADAHYLISLSDCLKKEIDRKNRYDWFKEECALLCHVRPSHLNQEHLFINFKGAGKLNACELTILEALLQFRRQEAIKYDKAFFRILSNQAIVQLTLSKSKTLAALAESDILKPNQMERFGPGIIKAIVSAMETPPDQYLIFPRRKKNKMSYESRARLKKLLNWRDQVTQELLIDPALVGTKSQLEMVASLKPSTIKDLSRLNVFRKWQIKEFGKQIINLLTE